jgi:hypothetical protein
MKYANESSKYVDSIKAVHIKKEWLIQYYRALAHLEFRKGQFEKAVEILNEVF